MCKFWVTIYLSKEVAKMSLEKPNCCFCSVWPRCVGSEFNKGNVIHHVKIPTVLETDKSSISYNRAWYAVIVTNPLSKPFLVSNDRLHFLNEVAEDTSCAIACLGF